MNTRYHSMYPYKINQEFIQLVNEVHQIEKKIHGCIQKLDCDFAHQRDKSSSNHSKSLI